MREDFESRTLDEAAHHAADLELPDDGPDPSEYMDDPRAETGWERCDECGARSPHFACPRCGERVRPPRTIRELVWALNTRHLDAVTPRDANRLAGV